MFMKWLLIIALFLPVSLPAQTPQQTLAQQVVKLQSILDEWEVQDVTARHSTTGRNDPDYIKQRDTAAQKYATQAAAIISASAQNFVPTHTADLAQYKKLKVLETQRVDEILRGEGTPIEMHELRRVIQYLDALSKATQ
jgi:hypothetical protein